MLHSGPFCPWRPALPHFGTVSQRILFNQGRVTHYFHRSTNDARATDSSEPLTAEGSAAMGEWQELQISWDGEEMPHPKL